MKAIDGKTEPPDSVPRSLHDIWHQGFEAGYERPVCRLHHVPKRAHYFCPKCREAGENVVVPLRGSAELRWDATEQRDALLSALKAVWNETGVMSPELAKQVHAAIAKAEGR